MILKDKKIYVYGLGKTGLSAINFLIKQGSTIFYFDDNKANIAPINGAMAKDIDEIDWHDLNYLLLSPGIQILKGQEHRVYKKALEHNIAITSDLDILYLANPEAKYIAITGTNGKSTTTALVAFILSTCGVKNYLGGNIGIPVLNLPLDKDAVYVIEASSYQLDLARDIKFEISALINLTPDHLDRHGNMDSYLQAKLKVFELQKENAQKFLSLDYEYLKKVAAAYPHAKIISIANKEADYFAEGRMITEKSSEYTADLSDTISLNGEHNIENSLFAFAICRAMGLDADKIVAAIKCFSGLEHRMELVGKYGNLTFINDSKATNADAAEKALKSFDNIVWILGGIPKDGGIESLHHYKDKIKEAYVIGQAKEDFAKVLGNWHIPNKITDTLSEAVKEIHGRIYPEGTVILLSPACASFDQFKNFEERGNTFKELIKKYYSTNE